MFGKVVVLMGGNGAEREVSLKTGNTVISALQKHGVEVESIDATPGFPGFVEKLIIAKPDRVFIAMHGMIGEGGSVQGLLDTLGIPYTGSGVLGSAIGMDKIRSKRLWQAIGLPTPPFSILNSEHDVDEFINAFGLPLAIKPVHEGSSIGVTKLTNKSNFKAAYTLAAKYGTVMLEQWITGEEYTVSIFNDEPLPAINVVPVENFHDYAAKYSNNNTSQNSTGCNEVAAEEQDYLQKLALAAFNAIGAKFWGRVDIIRDLNGDFWLLEVNTTPELTSNSLMLKAAKAVGINEDDLVIEILKQTLSASSKSSKTKSNYSASFDTNN